MSKFNLNLRKVIHGRAEVEANSLEEAKKKFEEGKEEYFEDFSENYPTEWVITSSEIYNEETEDFEEIE